MSGDFSNAIPTVYAGVQFKSRMEAQAALLFDQCGWKWEYEPFSLMLKNGVAYQPDFLLTETRAIVEVRGYESDKGNQQIDGFSREVMGLGFSAYFTFGPGESALLLYKWKHYEETYPLGLAHCLRCRRLVLAIIRDELNDESSCSSCCSPIQFSLPINIDNGKILVHGRDSSAWGIDRETLGAASALASLRDAIRHSGQSNDGAPAREAFHKLISIGTPNRWGPIECSGMTDAGFSFLFGLAGLLQPDLTFFRSPTEA